MAAFFFGKTPNINGTGNARPVPAGAEEAINDKIAHHAQNKG